MSRDFPPKPKENMSPGYAVVSHPGPPTIHAYYSYPQPPRHICPPHHAMSHMPSPVGVRNDIQRSINQDRSIHSPPGLPAPYAVAPVPPQQLHSFVANEKIKSKQDSFKSNQSPNSRTNRSLFKTEHASMMSSAKAGAEIGSQPREPPGWRPMIRPYQHPPAPLIYNSEGQWASLGDRAASHHHPLAPPSYHPHPWRPHPHPPARYRRHPPLPPSLPPSHLRDVQSQYWNVSSTSNSAGGATPSSVESSGNQRKTSHMEVDPTKKQIANRTQAEFHSTVVMPNTGQAVPSPDSSDLHSAAVDGREGATSPSQIETHHRDEVEHMGCTCKKTKCLKLYCQCFGVKIYCGANCRCLTCFNNIKHEKQRKEAMRSILSRNPTAFDTKFKKTGQSVSVVASSIAPENPRVLAHKLGCKCRKSNCMKKYCECYAASVKCNSTCRCVDCKNMGDSQYDHRDSAFPPESLSNHQTSLQVQSRMLQSQHSGEPWVAARNLTFLKRGSPASEQKNPLHASVEPYYAEVASMPSLASLSDGTSPSDGGPSKVVDEDDNEASDLFMAAIAMTEFGNSPPPKKDYHGMSMNIRKLDNLDGSARSRVGTTFLLQDVNRLDEDDNQHLSEHTASFEEDKISSNLKRSSNINDSITNFKRQKSDTSVIETGIV